MRNTTRSKTGKDQTVRVTLSQLIPFPGLVGWLGADRQDFPVIQTSLFLSCSTSSVRVCRFRIHGLWHRPVHADRRNTNPYQALAFASADADMSKAFNHHPCTDQKTSAANGFGHGA